MGGKSPHLVFADGLEFGDDLIDGLLTAAFVTSGQNCTAGTRILVHESIHDEVVARLSRRGVGARRLACPSDPATRDRPRHQLGGRGPHPCRDATARWTRARVVASGGARGRGASPAAATSPPTILTDVPEDDPDPHHRDLWPGHHRAEVLDPRRGDRDRQLGGLRPRTRASRPRTSTTPSPAARGVQAGVVSVGAYSEGDLTLAVRRLEAVGIRRRGEVSAGLRPVDAREGGLDPAAGSVVAEPLWASARPIAGTRLRARADLPAARASRTGLGHGTRHSMLGRSDSGP